MTPFTFFCIGPQSTENRWIITETGDVMIGEANEGSDTSVFDFGSFSSNGNHFIIVFKPPSAT